MIDPDERDMLAAEYVLGTLGAAEREQVAARLSDDHRLASAVRDWEDRLSPLVDAVPDVDPPAGAYQGIATRLFGVPSGASGLALDDAVVALRRRVRRWRGATAGFALLAAALLAWIAAREVAPSHDSLRYTAVLQRDPGAPALLIDVDLAARRFVVRPFGAAPPAGRAYELWLISPSVGTPRSLGVVSDDAGIRGSVKPFDGATITGATYAVTLEAPGGSPTGRPTSVPVLTGRLSAFPS